MVEPQNSFNLEDLERKCEQNEFFLTNLINNNLTRGATTRQQNLYFGVARRWNSWYPSYFDVEGGCYVLLPGDAPDPEKRGDDRPGAIVIDPGFRFIDILRSTYHIEPQDISTVIVTHMHPDHMAGLLEYVTLMNASGKSSKLYLNPTTYASFRSVQNANISVSELTPGQIQRLANYTSRNKETHTEITLQVVGVHHNEIGNQHHALGLIFEISRTLSETPKIYRIGILGDTDGHRQYVPEYVKNFHGVDILVLHLGTFSNRKFADGGKHLYIQGVQNILEGMREAWKEEDPKNRIVVLSEFGLELADDESLFRKLHPFIESFSWRLPLITADLYFHQEVKERPTEESKLFARSVFSLLEQVYYTLQPTVGYLKNPVTIERIDEILISLTFQLFARKSVEVENAVKSLEEKVDTILQKDLELHFFRTSNLEQIHDLLKGLLSNSSFNAYQEYYRYLVKIGLGNLAPTQENLAVSRSNLIETCDRLMGRIIQFFSDPVPILGYLHMLEYISAYARSRKLKEYSWALETLHNDGHVKYFWLMGLIGLYMLRVALQDEIALAGPKENSSLVMIGRHFSRALGKSSNFIIGDIGCTFGIEPFAEIDEREKKGFLIRDYQNNWIDAYKAESFYYEKTDSISYRAPK